MKPGDKRKHNKLPPSCKKHEWKPGQSGSSVGRPPGQPLLSRVREILGEKSKKADGTYNTRFDDAANAFVEQMENGSFIHTKEYIDREQGKVPTRVADADGKNLKLYVGMPVDDEDPESP